MDKHHIRRLMVTDGHDGVAGTVSRRDLMKMFATE
jgi:predicted transcriptional regulator